VSDFITSDEGTLQLDPSATPTLMPPPSDTPPLPPGNFFIVDFLASKTNQYLGQVDSGVLVDEIS
jgi:hypothetical protein